MIRRIDATKAYNFQNSAQRSQQNTRLTTRTTTVPTLSKVKDPWNELHRTLPSSFQPLFQSEAKSEVFVMKISFRLQRAYESTSLARRRRWISLHAYSARS